MGWKLTYTYNFYDYEPTTKIPITSLSTCLFTCLTVSICGLVMEDMREGDGKGSFKLHLSLIT